MYLANYVKLMDDTKVVPVPIDVLTKDNLVNWKDFINTHFELRQDSFVSKELVLYLFKTMYPNFDCSVRQIIKEVSRLPAEYMVSYDRTLRNKADGKRGHFFGLYSIHEQDNVRAVRDMALKP
mmetsp:Transcript_21170/g.30333  ORF Transcript_21170/g.30333 Transcript_21170/m.30333 type:complete len:123 (+) Transcript_21170:1242-1610(+)